MFIHCSLGSSHLSQAPSASSTLHLISPAPLAGANIYVAFGLKCEVEEVTVVDSAFVSRCKSRATNTITTAIPIIASKRGLTLFISVLLDGSRLGFQPPRFAEHHRNREG